MKYGWRAGLLFCFSLGLAACQSRFEAPEVQGPPAMVNHAARPSLWILFKQKEVRHASQFRRWHSVTRFHFDLKAFDPGSVRPLWSQRLLTLGDAANKGLGPSRVIHSAASGRLLGQDGDIVWLLIDNAPLAVSAADGSLVLDAAGLEQRNPILKGLLPRDAKHYGFDRGLVLMGADARRFVVRGPQLQAIAYTPPAVPGPTPQAMTNRRQRIVPTVPIGNVPARQLIHAGKWLGLYTEKEAADAGNDAWGDKLRYPYTVINEGALARRGFWRGTIVSTQRFEERFDRLADLAPIVDAPTFLNGRFLKDLASGKPLQLDAPAGMLVWHSTRIDSDGRLAMTRLDTDLQPVWSIELPLSESGTVNRVMYWLWPDRVVVTGELQSIRDGISQREPHLVSIRLADGKWQARNLQRESNVDADG